MYIILNADTEEKIEEYRYLEDFFSDYVSDDDVKDWIDSAYEPIDLPIIGEQFISTIIERLDKVAYSMIRDDYVDNLAENCRYNIEHSGYDEYYFNNEHYKIIDKE